MTWLVIILAAPLVMSVFALLVAWLVERGRGPREERGVFDADRVRRTKRK